MEENDPNKGGTTLLMTNYWNWSLTLDHRWKLLNTNGGHVEKMCGDFSNVRHILREEHVQEVMRCSIDGDKV